MSRVTEAGMEEAQQGRSSARSDEPEARSGDELQRELVAWRDKAIELWEITARIGATLHAAYKSIPDKEWPGWLEQVDLSPYAAFCFMKAQHYPELMREHKPSSLGAIQRVLPQGQGSAFDAEQAACARRLAEGGMTQVDLRVRFGVTRDTLHRWLDPDDWSQRLEQRRAAKQARDAQVHADRQKKRLAAAKAKPGPGPVAYGHLRKTAEALQEAISDSSDRDARRAFESALQVLYRAEDALGKALKL